MEESGVTHTIGIISRLCVLAGSLFAVAYGLVCLMQKRTRRFFTVAFLGVCAVFLSRLFYLILAVSNGNDSAFSVGIFGQISAYLFFIVADCSFIPGHRGKQPFSVAGFLAALPPSAVFLYIAIRTGTVGAILCEGLYILCLSPAVYYAVRVIVERKKNRTCAAVTPFHWCVFGLVYCNIANEILQLGSDFRLIYVALGLAIISGLLLAVMLPLLKKGVEQWET